MITGTDSSSLVLVSVHINFKSWLLHQIELNFKYKGVSMVSSTSPCCGKATEVLAEFSNYYTVTAVIGQNMT